MRPQWGTRDLVADYEYVKTLNDGEDGVGGMNGGVFIVKRIADGKRCIQKDMEQGNRGAVNHFRDEIRMLHRLEHANVVAYLDAFLTTTTPPLGGLFMEYCEFGTLRDVVDKYLARPTHEYMPESFIWHAYHNMLKALAYLHFGTPADAPVFAPRPGWRTVIHRDLKPDNIFLKRPLAAAAAAPPRRYPQIVLGDFGLALRKGDSHWGLRSACGTFQWQGPEVPVACLAGRGDVWAAAAIVQHLCRFDGGPVGAAPHGWPDLDWTLYPGARNPRPAGRKYSPQLNRALHRGLVWDVQQRPSSGVLLMHVKRLYAEARPKVEDMPEWVFDGWP
ncbi:MAG: hypothetical protein M1833_003873 [Piccolia ochrophora]|nr:MAG: hypothetical protein M1833_003873 [Piccolia ochrophora]